MGLEPAVDGDLGEGRSTAMLKSCCWRAATAAEKSSSPTDYM